MPRELMVEEYKALKREQMQYAASVSRWQMLGFVSAGAAVALAFAVGQMIVASAALLVLAGCILGIMRDLASMQRVAAYLQVFLEGQDTGVQWEQRIEKIDRLDEFMSFTGQLSSVTSLLWIGFICAFVACAQYLIAGLKTGSGLLISTLLIPIAWIVFWMVISVAIMPLHRNRVKSKFLDAFYESLKKP